jgi:predicted RNase H-like HicB family nuclease
MPLTVEVEQEDDGRWLAEVLEIPGALAYGPTREEAIEWVQALVRDCLPTASFTASRRPPSEGSDPPDPGLAPDPGRTDR